MDILKLKFSKCIVCAFKLLLGGTCNWVIVIAQPYIAFLRINVRACWAEEDEKKPVRGVLMKEFGVLLLAWLV